MISDAPHYSEVLSVWGRFIIPSGGVQTFFCRWQRRNEGREGPPMVAAALEFYRRRQCYRWQLQKMFVTFHLLHPTLHPFQSDPWPNRFRL